MALLILKPERAPITYTRAAEAFQELYRKVTGQEISISDADDGVSDLIVIGSDAVSDFVMNEVFELRLGSLGIRYGTDDYCIRSHNLNGRRCLILAGGRGRSTVYAVYDYFERFLGCHYFWDGDVIGHADAIPMENICVNEAPRFEYRGLRYFAHRGLKRFQAEHWSFGDWKQEIDWMVKKRLNFFMLRIGMDDVWQRAFPDAVPYPDGFYNISGTDANGYDDRSDFWTLEYRGKLRERILEYARELDLMYPTDCGTMTHWYSRTPVEFLENRKPTFANQDVAHYTASDTGRVFDFTKRENMDYYVHLTDTMVREYEKTTGLFHTIGLGERRMYNDKDKNFALKLIAYRRIAENIRQKYPDSKLMLASWDFLGHWTPDEVQKLTKELDPERTIILDYTSEGSDPNESFLNWDVVGKFPWIFGLFHAYESESEIRGPYDLSDERVKVAAEDSFCKGLVLWPELSHSDPLVLEYLTQNGWDPLRMNVEQLAEHFCGNRYGSLGSAMNECWQMLLPYIKLGEWGGYSHRKPGDENYTEYFNSWYTHQDIWVKPTAFLNDRANSAGLAAHFAWKLERARPMLGAVVAALEKLAENCVAAENLFVLRDAVDLTKTVLGRMMNVLWMQAADPDGDKTRLPLLRRHCLALLDTMEQLLSLIPDYSMYETLKALEATAPTNPRYETVLKRNINNEYCVQPAYELTAYIHKPETEAVFAWLTGETETDYRDAYREIVARFDAMPLKDMQPKTVPAPEAVISRAAAQVAALAKEVL